MKKLHLVLMFFVLVFCATRAFSQSPSATLTGVVFDPNSAVIVGATVTATNKATNLSRTAETNEEGVYVISNLPVGEYEVKTEAKGFQLYKADRILNVGQTLNSDVYLVIASSTYIPIIDIYKGVDTQTSKVDAVINDKEIEN